MTRLYLVRHGETDWNLEGRWQGQTDVPLNGRGRLQAEQTAAWLADEGLAAVYTSDLKRAVETARLIAEPHGVQVIVDPRLRETNLGKWEGMLLGEIEAKYEKEFEARRSDPFRMAPPGGENAHQVQERVLAAIHEIVERHPDGRAAVISHGYALATVRSHFLKLPIEQLRELVPQNGEIIVVDVDSRS
jgi:broad specificity phosphatase PhoE